MNCVADRIGTSESIAFMMCLIHQGGDLRRASAETGVFDTAKRCDDFGRTGTSVTADISEQQCSMKIDLCRLLEGAIFVRTAPWCEQSHLWSRARVEMASSSRGVMLVQSEPKDSHLLLARRPPSFVLDVHHY